MRRILLALATLAAIGIALAPAIQAAHTATTPGRGGVCPSWTVQYDVVDSDDGPFYVVNDGVLANGVTFSVWIYQESNGVAGLQRHDDFCYTPGYNSDSVADTIIF